MPTNRAGILILCGAAILALSGDICSKDPGKPKSDCDGQKSFGWMTGPHDAAPATAETLSVSITECHGSDYGDQYQGVAGEDVTWMVVSGGGKVNQFDTVTTVTDQDGKATVIWRFGSTSGPQMIRVTAYIDDARTLEETVQATQ